MYSIVYTTNNIKLLKDFSLDFLEELKQLEPFGAGNEEPIICLENPQILELKRMGNNGQHLRIDLKGKDGKILKCVAFFASESWFNINYNDSYNFLVKPVENEWNGVRSIEARLVDIL